MARLEAREADIPKLGGDAIANAADTTLRHAGEPGPLELVVSVARGGDALRAFERALDQPWPPATAISRTSRA